MTLPEAVKTLRAFNLWRRGDESAMLSPELIGRAIDAACDAADALIESDRMHRERAA